MESWQMDTELQSVALPQLAQLWLAVCAPHLFSPQDMANVDVITNFIGPGLFLDKVGNSSQSRQTFIFNIFTFKNIGFYSCLCVGMYT